MAEITKEEYLVQLRNYITIEMRNLQHNGESVAFWAQFNKDKQVEFDAQLAANGVTVVI